MHNNSLRLPTLMCRHTGGYTVETERCPLCGQRHYHGIAGLTDGGTHRHRTAHCLTEEPPRWVRKLGDTGLTMWRQAVAAGYMLELVN